MIYTVTFNPAIDYIVRMENLKLGEINRADSEEVYFGGKGINVSIVLNELGIRSRVLGFVAGFTGEAIEKGVKAAGIETDFVHLDRGLSRINVKLKAAQETDLNGRGPEIPGEKITELLHRLDRLRDGDTIILAGSIPPSLPEDIYEKILDRLKDKTVRTVVDAAGQLLANVLKYRPFLVKPNNIELGEIFGVKLDTADEAAEYAEKLQRMGTQNVLVSMAGDGAVLLDESGKLYRCGACRGTVKNSVGAGDSMVAGFIAGCESGDYGYALKLGTAAGGATAFSDGLAKKDDIARLLRQLDADPGTLRVRSLR